MEHYKQEPTNAGAIHAFNQRELERFKRNHGLLKSTLEELNNQLIHLEYFCDDARHLVCVPYSIGNLHLMAKRLNIKKQWFHKTHYDIPKKRTKEITEKCTLVSSKEIVKIIKNEN